MVVRSTFRLQNRNASSGLRQLRRDADALVDWTRRKMLEKELIDDVIEKLVMKSKKEAGFSKMSNVKKFIARWREKDVNITARVVSSTGPTIEHPDEKVKNAYYVIIRRI